MMLQVVVKAIMFSTRMKTLKLKEKLSYTHKLSLYCRQANFFLQSELPSLLSIHEPAIHIKQPKPFRSLKLS